MYEIYQVHELAVKRKDDVLMENYGKLRNTTTDMIKTGTGNTLTRLAIHCIAYKSIPNINMKSIPKGMGAEDFDIYI